MIEPATSSYAVDDTIPNAWTPVAPVAAASDSTVNQRIASGASTESTEFGPPAAAQSNSLPGPEPARTQAPSWHTEVVDPEPMPAHVPVSHAQPVIARNAPEIPRVSLELPPDSGLVLVETRRGQTASAKEDEADGPRPRRKRPPRVEIADEPLQLVETHKEPTPPAA